MKTKIISVFVILVFILLIVVASICNDETTNSEAYIPSETSTEIETAEICAGATAVLSETALSANVTIDSNGTIIVGNAFDENEEIILEAEKHERVKTDDPEQLQELMAECESRMASAEQMLASCEGLGYNEYHPSYKLAQEEYDNAQSDWTYYDSLLAQSEKAQKQAHLDACMSEYPAATQVWIYLTETLGYNEHVSAAIIGNMMAEVGGQTLNLQPMCSGRGYFGVCQWRIKYAPKVNGRKLQGQLDYLAETIPVEFKNFGKLACSYDTFVNMQDEKKAAVAFAKVYERCGSGSYSKRQKNATKAYNYFTQY